VWREIASVTTKKGAVDLVAEELVAAGLKGPVTRATIKKTLALHTILSAVVRTREMAA